MTVSQEVLRLKCVLMYFVMYNSYFDETAIRSHAFAVCLHRLRAVRCHISCESCHFLSSITLTDPSWVVLQLLAHVSHIIECRTYD